MKAKFLEYSGKFALLILLSWTARGADLADEDRLLQQLSSLETETHVSYEDTYPKVLSLFQNMNPDTTPRAWVYALSLLEFATQSEIPQASLDRMAKHPKIVNDSKSTILLQMIQFEKLVAAGNYKSAINSVQDIKKSTCADPQLKVWCGRILHRIAQYQYDMSEIADGLISIRQSLEMLHHLQGPERFYYIAARQILGFLLESKKELKEAQLIEQENFQWFQTQGYAAEAATSAYNFALSLMQHEPMDLVQIDYYLSEANRLAHISHDVFTQGLSFYGRGILLTKTQRNLEALSAFNEAYKIFTSLDNQLFAARARINSARPLIALKRYKEARTCLDQAESLLLPSNKAERMPLLKYREQIALAEGDPSKAHAYLKQYMKEWSDQKDEDEKKGIATVRVQLGLQIEEERNLALQNQIELQNQKLKEAERFKIFVTLLSCLSLSTLILLVIALRQSGRASKSQKEIQLILDHIDEGLLTINRQGRIDRNHSKHLNEMLGNPVGFRFETFAQSILHKSTLAPETTSMVQEILQLSLGEDQLAWELNCGNLPKELKIDCQGLKTFTIRWIPIIDRHGVLQKILVNMTDITEARSLEQALGDQKQRLQSLPEILQEVVQVQPHRLRKLIDHTRELLQVETNLSDRSMLLGRIHTQKGVARALGLPKMSQCLHDFETLIQMSPSEEPKVDPKETLSRLDEYLFFLNILHPTLVNNQGESPSSLFQVGVDFAPEWTKRMEQQQCPIQSIEIHDERLSWTSEQLEIAKEICLHAINNSLDHGFLLPLSKSQEVASPRVHITALQMRGQIRLEVRDNGFGLNLKKIEDLAKAQDFAPQPGGCYSDFLFHSGMSTAENLTMTSGRGVGLSALKALMTEKQGRLGIHNNPDGSGTTLWAQWPESMASIDSKAS